MSYQLLIRPQARLDIRAAFTWYEEQELGLGTEFLRAVEAALEAIQRTPLAYKVIRKQTRRAPLRRFPYGIFIVSRQIQLSF